MAKKRRIKIRKTWRINPRTRVKKSNKRYRRPKAKSNFKKLLKKEVRQHETKTRYTKR